MWIEEGGIEDKKRKAKSYSCGFEVIGSLHSHSVEGNDTCNSITIAFICS